jgi:hypothetical protein
MKIVFQSNNCVYLFYTKEFMTHVDGFQQEVVTLTEREIQIRGILRKVITTMI